MKLILRSLSAAVYIESRDTLQPKKRVRILRNFMTRPVDSKDGHK